MADDDLMPDEALVARLEDAVNSLATVAELTRVRSHLPREGMDALVKAGHTLVGEMNAAKHPDDEINAKYRARMRGEYLITSMGVKFYPFDPKVEEITHLDIVIGLTNTVRYNGQLSRPDMPHVPRPLSVAEHSVKTAAIAELLCERDELGQELTNLAGLHALLHDAHEAYLGDTIRPIKARLYDSQTGQPFSRTEHAVQDVILSAYGLPPVPAEVDAIVREADMLAYACEVISIRRQTVEDDNNPLPVVTPEVLAVGRIKHEPPPRDVVRALLDGEIQRLVTLCGGVVPGPQRPPSVAETTVDPSHSLERLAQLKQIPGNDVHYRSLGPEKPDTGYMPSRIERAPRPDDVSQSSWKDAIKGLGVPTPVQLIQEIQDELDNPETSELKKKVLQEEMTRLQSVNAAPADGSA